MYLIIKKQSQKFIMFVIPNVVTSVTVFLFVWLIGRGCSLLILNYKKIKMKNNIKEKLMLVLGLFVLPFAYCLWIIDRIMFTLMPQSEHKKLNDWLTNTSVVYALTRVVTLFSLVYIIKWMLGLWKDKQWLKTHLMSL